MSEQFSGCNMTSSRGSFKSNSFEINIFPYLPLKRINSAFDKIGLFFQTVLQSEAKSLLRPVQLDFIWTSFDKMIGSQGYLTVRRVP